MEPIQKALFSRLCLLEITVRPFISLMAKSLKFITFLASKLEHFENYIHQAAKTFSIPYLNRELISTKDG